ncbi:type II toxin-antitoxin system PemK/MazF family toxin [Pseudomonas fluorescens]|uniref:type II toxin-antitoxin system PemK/MazF family toxin n=1 Tax=Pseudomonas fluorescens TaxID=294 RepID=UPI003D019611
MVKVRPVVVVRKHRSNRLLVTVVPLSTTAPDSVLQHHLQLESHLQEGARRVGRNATCWLR